MPDRYVLDAHAWVEYLRGSPPGFRVKEVIEDSSIYTSSVTLAEVTAHVARSKGNVDLAARAIQSISDIVELDNELALKAGKRYARSKDSLEHAYLVETAKKVGAEIVSGDKSFISARKVSLK